MDKQQLILDYMPYAESLAGLFTHKYQLYTQHKEVLSTAYLTLIKSANNFDQTKASFKTYLYNRIKGAVLDDIRNMKPLPRSETVIDFVSLDSNTTSDNTLHDIITDMDKQINVIELIHNKEMINKAIKKLKVLPEKRQLIMNLIYVEDKLQGEVGKVIGRTKNRVNQIHREIMSILREELKEAA
jgi:RNA polymerase sigma factor (sigma-70 family)